MIFKEIELKGAYIIELEPKEDSRGLFARSFCKREFEAHGIDFWIVQTNISYNKKAGTLRGMHYQAPPHAEAKLVSCNGGVIYDVIIDLRPDSPTYCQWVSVNLSSNNYRMIYIPQGFAHGFQTLADNSVVLYQISEFYHPECARGVRWDDPALGITWPLKQKVISDKDKSFSFLEVPDGGNQRANR